MKKLFVIGDMHFSTSRPWDEESFKNFLDWYDKQEFGPFEDCELLQLGDVTEKATNTGKPFEMLTSFFEMSLRKFSKIYVLGGNHCHKWVTEKGESQYVTQYLPYMSNRIKVIFEEEIFDAIDGLKVLALPHKHVVTTIEDYYNNNLPSVYYETPVDLICGHTGIFDKAFPYISGLMLDKFNFKFAAFGHIHNRWGSNKKMYTGSIMPFRKGEQNCELPSCIKVFTKDAELDEIQLPQFRSYETIDFRNTKPTYKKFSDKVVHIYELDNCRDKNSAKIMYNDYYFKFGKITEVEAVNSENGAIENSVIKVFDNYYDAFQKMCKEKGITFKRKTHTLLKDLLVDS